MAVGSPAGTHMKSPMLLLIASGGWILFAPKHPGREDAIEQGLYQAGAEEVLTFPAFKFQSEGLLKRSADVGQSGQFAFCLDTRLGFAGVEREYPCDILRSDESGGRQDGELKKIDKARALFLCGRAGMSSQTPESLFIFGEAIGTEIDGRAFGISAKEDEVAVIGDENLSVFLPVAADLAAVGRDPSVVAGWLDLDCAASGLLAGKGFVVLEPLKLVFGEEAAVRKAGATILEGENAADFGFEFAADRVKQVTERRVVRGFAGGFAGGADFLQFLQVGFEIGVRGHGELLSESWRQRKWQESVGGGDWCKVGVGRIQAYAQRCGTQNRLPRML